MTHEADSLKKNTTPLNILLVEDSEADVKITIRAFKNATLNNNLFVVNNGQECVDFLFHQAQYKDKEKYPRPDLILVDINMPKMDGFGVLKAVKRDKELKVIPVIVLTGSKNKEDVMESYINGANSFIQKPVDYEEFVQLIEGFNYYWHVVNKLSTAKT